jgi:hypothetical protein
MYNASFFFSLSPHSLSLLCNAQKLNETAAAADVEAVVVVGICKA